MGRQGAVVSTPPPAAVQSPPAMPPLPPKPPNKRYLMENPPGPAGGLLQHAEVSSQRHRAPPVGHLANYADQTPAHPPTGYAPRPPNGANGCRPYGRRPPCEEPLNLTTAATTEVRLSGIVDRVVERMLKRNQADSHGCSGDPLRLWFTNQFETKQRNECSSSGSSPSPRQKSTSPQLPSPAAAETADPTDPTGVMELTIGMSDTINRVIDNAYRDDAAGKRCEVTSCSSDSVNSTTTVLEALTTTPRRRAPPAAAASPPTRRANRSHRSHTRAAAAPSAADVGTATSLSRPKRCRPAAAPSPADRLVVPTGDDDDDGRCGLVVDDSRCVDSGAAPADTPDSRTGDGSPPTERPGSPRRRVRKRNAPTELRIANVRTPLDFAHGRAGRKRKVGKEDIVRIQKGECIGVESIASSTLRMDKSTHLPK